MSDPPRTDTPRRSRGFLEHVGGAAYRRIDDADWTLEFVSNGCLSLCGYSRTEFERGVVSWGRVIHPEDRDAAQFEVRAALQASATYDVEYRIVTYDHHERWVSDRGGSGPSSRDGRMRHEGVIIDITERKRDERALADSRAFLEAVVETAAEAVITIDKTGRIETFNRAAQAMFGYTIDDVRGRNVNMLMPDPYQSEHDGYIARYLATGEPRIIGTGREVLARRRDGTVFPIFLSVSEVQVHPQRKFVGLIRDISKQREAERAAREHLEQLAHVDRLNMLGEMATGMAHEINSPLTAISLFSQAGKRLLDAGNVERLPDIFDKLSQHAERAGAIIERMQSMARRGESARAVVAPNDLIREVATLAEAEARIRDVGIVLDLVDGLPDVEVDAVQIQQVALNLLRNGMEAMREIGCTHGRTITLATRPASGNYVEVSVIDSGSGVSDDVAEDLFTPFMSTKEHGMGMGLSLSRTIVSAHGGQLAFRNNDGFGATFHFTLPAKDAS